MASYSQRTISLLTLYVKVDLEKQSKEISTFISKTNLKLEKVVSHLSPA